MILKKVLLYYHTIKYMRYEHLLWRIFFWTKKSVYKRLNFLIGLTYTNKFKNVQLNSDYKFFKGKKRVDIEIQTGSCAGFLKYKDSFNKAGLSRIIENNEFRFLNKTVSFNNGIEWQSTKCERLWLYNLHYFDYAFELGIAYILGKDNVFFNVFKKLTIDWIDKNQKIGCGYGWEPYPLSLRIVNWIYAYNLFCEQIKRNREFEDRFLTSLAVQTACLSKNIEFHVSRNHLIKNGKALFLAGMFFNGTYAQKWEKEGFNILIKGIGEQVLDDGGHYERSPMYHLIVLQDYLEMLILAKRNNIDFPVNEKLWKMVCFLVNILHPDNKIPLFNDSAFDIAKDPGEILQIASFALNGLPDYAYLFTTTLFTILLTGDIPKIVIRGTPDNTTILPNSDNVAVNEDSESVASNHSMSCMLFKDSGFCSIRNKKNDKFFIIGYKDPSPFHLPGHSHSDILSYELSLGNKRFIIDSGVNNYQPGKWREYFRSSRAHNTLTVNKHNQSELWGIFGIARRAISLSAHLHSDNGNNIVFDSGYKGFSEFHNICHQRNVYFIDDLFWIIFDTVKGLHNDQRSYHVENFIHVHPERNIEVVKSPDNVNNFIIYDETQALHVCPMRISALSGEELLTILHNDMDLEIVKGDKKIIQGWYSPEFGNIKENNVIVIGKKGLLPLHIGYLLFPSLDKSVKVSAFCKFDSEKCLDTQNSILNLSITTPEFNYQIRKKSFDINIKKTGKIVTL